MIKATSSRRFYLLIFVSVVTVYSVTSDDKKEYEAYCKGSNETVDATMAVIFFCQVNSTTDETYNKTMVCYKKVAPKDSPPFPTNFTDVPSIKKFLCQPNYESIDGKLEKCVQQSKKEESEEDQRVEDCLKYLEKEALAAESINGTSTGKV